MAAAACGSLSVAGTGTRLSAVAATYSAYDPNAPLQATRSPTFTVFASAPTAVTSPAPSCPGVNGNGVRQLPSRKRPSIEFTPAMETLTKASFGLGRGV